MRSGQSMILEPRKNRFAGSDAVRSNCLICHCTSAPFDRGNGGQSITPYFQNHTRHFQVQSCIHSFSFSHLLTHSFIPPLFPSFPHHITPQQRHGTKSVFVPAAYGAKGASADHHQHQALHCRSTQALMVIQIQHHRGLAPSLCCPAQQRPCPPISNHVSYVR